MGLFEDLHNPNLFTDNKPGDYTYIDGALGKIARGQIFLDGPVLRDSAAQRSAGGEARREPGNLYGIDDGGHLIGARFGGSTGKENLSAQDRNLNRQDYKNMENTWASLRSDKESNTKVFVHVETYDPGKTDRPENYQGYYIVEQTGENGETMRTWEVFSFNNESRETMREINDALESYGINDSFDCTAEFHYDEGTDKLVPNPNYAPDSGEIEKKTAEQTHIYDFSEEAGGKIGQNTEHFSEKDGIEESCVLALSEVNYGVPESNTEQSVAANFAVNEHSTSEHVSEDAKSNCGQSTDGTESSVEIGGRGHEGNGGQGIE